MPARIQGDEHGLGSAIVTIAWTSNPTAQRRLASAGAALVSLALLAGPALAQNGFSASQPDNLIIAPLLEEMANAPLPAMHQMWIEGEEGWRISEPARSADAAMASRKILTSRAPLSVRRSLSVFSAPQAVIARTSSGGYVTVSVFDSEQPDAFTTALTSDRADMPAWAFSAERDRHRAFALRYEGRFDSYGGMDGLDVGFRPRAGLAMSDRGSATEFGASIRLGQYLNSGDDARNGWWFFAGADRQAVIIEPGQRFDLRSTLTLQPYAMVGDAQAGLAMRIHGADLSLAYVRRETSWSIPTQSWDAAEDFAAFSLTFRR